MKKTLGIIGKGAVIEHLFKNLGKYGPDKDGNLFFDYDADDFLEQVGRIVFYNGAYETEERFRESRGFADMVDADGTSVKGIESSIRELAVSHGLNFRVHTDEQEGNLERRVEDDQLVLEIRGRADPFMNGAGGFQENTGEFERFFTESDVIVDASGEYMGRPPTLKEYADYLLLPAHKKAAVKKPVIDMEKDWRVYCGYVKKSGKCNKGKTKFADEWNLMYQLIEDIHSVRESKDVFGFVSSFGERILSELPFYVPMILERGQRLRDLMETGCKARPSYINLVNEPGVTSMILASLCPEIAGNIVGWSAVDSMRLLKVIRDKYGYAATDEELEKLWVPVLGLHDENLMIPILSEEVQLTAKSRQTFANLEKRVNMEQAFDKLNNEINIYWNKYQDEDHVWMDYDKSILALIINSCRSKGDVFSSFPKDGEPLCNILLKNPGHENPVYLSGVHGFRNGQPLEEKISVPSQLREKETMVYEVATEIFTKIKQLALKLDVRFPERRKAYRERRYFATDGTKVAEASVAGKKGRVIMQGKRYSTITSFSLDERCLTAAGYEAGVEMTDPDQPEVRREIRLSGRQVKVASSIAFSPSIGDDNFLLATFKGVGAIRVGMREFQHTKRLEISLDEISDYLLLESANQETLRVAAARERFIISRGGTVYGYDGRSDRIRKLYTIPGTIKSLVARNDDIFSGTSIGEIYKNDELYCRFPSGNPMIKRMQPVYYKGIDCILFSIFLNKAYGGVYFTGGEEPSRSAPVRISRFGAMEKISDFHYDGQRLVVLDRGEVKFQGGDGSITTLDMPRGRMRIINVYGGE